MDNESISQLRALAQLASVLTAAGIDYWVFGGWAVDLYAGRVTRPHADIDIVVEMAHLEQAQSLLASQGWARRPAPEPAGYEVWTRDEVRLDLAAAARDYAGESDWAPGALADDVRRLDGVDLRVIALHALIADKSQDYGDPAALRKDRGDLAVLKDVTDTREDRDGNGEPRAGW